MAVAVVMNEGLWRAIGFQPECLLWRGTSVLTCLVDDCTTAGTPACCLSALCFWGQAAFSSIFCDAAKHHADLMIALLVIYLALRSPLSQAAWLLLLLEGEI